MHLIVVTGFLGSGKTTFIVKLAKIAMEKGLKVAIIVNELGEIGIDDQFMKELGFNVREILGGCICCTLVGDLVQTINKLQADYSPDVVIVEPSGAADPRNIVGALSMNPIESLRSKRQIALLDPLRMEMLITVVEPLIVSTIRQADLVLINKADTATAEQIEYTRRVVDQAHPDARVMVISAKNDPEPQVWSEISSCMG